MTNANLEKANLLKDQMKGIEDAISVIDGFLRGEDKKGFFHHYPMFRLRCLEKEDCKCYPKIVYAVFGSDARGVEIPLDNNFANFLKEGLEKQLSEKRKEFEEL